MNDRCWREEAIGWFESWWRAGRPHFDNPSIVIEDFVNKTRQLLRSGDRESLERFRRERAERALVEIVPIDTALVAICDLALEDFR